MTSIDLETFYIDKDHPISLTVTPCEGKTAQVPADGVTARLDGDVLPTTPVVEDNTLVIAFVIPKDTQTAGKKKLFVYPNTDNGSDYFEFNAIIEGIESNS